MNYNANRYYLAESKQLSEPEKLQLAKDLVELERQGILAWRDGTWGLVEGVEVEETSAGPVARFRKQNDAVPGQLAASSVTSSGEPSDAQGVPPLSKAARPSREGSSSADQDDQDSDQ
jgi:hypothetical protein